MEDFRSPSPGKSSEGDEIWHLGDFCDFATLNAVKDLGRPFFAVRGNNDFTLDLPEKLLLERHGKTFSSSTFHQGDREVRISCCTGTPMSHGTRWSAQRAC